LQIKGATECFPFDNTTLVFKVMGKMFAFMGLERHEHGHLINLKCDPEKALQLREQYPCIIPGYHSNKKYWNSIYFECPFPPHLLEEWVQHSVDEVIKKLPLKQQQEYNRITE
jgi:predicted DNA-binding protein (MmcQ/YjbR family)